MPNSKSAPYFAHVLCGIVGLVMACVASVGPPGGSASAGASAATGSGAASVSGTGSAGRGTSGSGGGGSGVGGTGSVAGSSGGISGISGATGSGTAGVSAGRGGVTGAGGSGGGGAVGTPPTRGPTPATSGVNFPFPQNRALAGCTTPTGYLNSDVLAAYAQWRADTITSSGAGGNLRVQRLATDTQNANTPLNSTVSEGIGYGMTIAVFTGDKMVFDGLWKYEQQHRNANGLMDWAISATGTVTGMGAATDADEDMAFALAMADKQWGGYTSDALFQIKAVWNNEIWESKLPRNGDGWGDWNNLNISYFAPAYYRVFKQLDSDPTHKWDDVIATVYDTINSALNAANGNLSNGLVPAWCTSTGSAVATSAGAPPPFNYQYDSCRTPFRIGLDWCWFGETRARDYVAKTSGFFSALGAANIVDGYDLNGAKHVQFSPASTPPTLPQQSAAFLGPAAVGAMSDVRFQSFLDASYARVATRQMLVGGTYYDESWGVMSLLAMTGNFLNYTAIQPAH